MQIETQLFCHSCKIILTQLEWCPMCDRKELELDFRFHEKNKPGVVMARGCVTIFPKHPTRIGDKRASLDLLSVRPEYRRHGVGSRMMKLIMKRLGHIPFRVHPCPFGEGSLMTLRRLKRFYNRYGFKYQLSGDYMYRSIYFSS